MAIILGTVAATSLALNYWELKFCLRAKLECRIFGAVALDLVDLGWLLAPRGGCDLYSGLLDKSTFIGMAAVRVDIISTLF